MKRKAAARAGPPGPKPRARHKPVAKAEQAPATAPEAVTEDDGSERIVARPDGFHWLALDGRNEFGPFETIDEARADMLAAGEGLESLPAETLQEAEDEIGIADWIDPETGEPAEGHSPPHLEQE